MDKGANSYRRFLDGEDEGLYEIVKDYKDGLILYVNSIVGNLYVAEEVVQETFTKLIIKKTHFFGRSSFKTWLYAIARNLAVDELRRNGKSPIDLSEVENYIQDEQQLEDAYLVGERQAEINTLMRKAMHNMKAEHSQALWLIYFEGFSNADAARILRKSRHQFENLLYRAKKLLKNQLEKEGFVYEKL